MINQKRTMLKSLEFLLAGAVVLGLASISGDSGALRDDKSEKKSRPNQATTIREDRKSEKQPYNEDTNEQNSDSAHYVYIRPLFEVYNAKKDLYDYTVNEGEAAALSLFGNRNHGQIANLLAKQEKGALPICGGKNNTLLGYALTRKIKETEPLYHFKSKKSGNSKFVVGEKAKIEMAEESDWKCSEPVLFVYPGDKVGKMPSFNEQAREPQVNSEF